MGKYYLAIDIGASSGRHIIGSPKSDGSLELKEIFRFKNGMINSPDGLVWDLDSIYKNILIGIKKAFEEYKEIESLSIDTWGVDYVIIKDGKGLKPFYAYRNSRTKEVINEVHSKIPFERLYEITGTQFQEMNTIYQLYHDTKYGRFNGAEGFLMIPEYFMYLLTGVKKKEYTNASTTGMLDAKTREYSDEIIQQLGMNKKLFGKLNQPGEFVGKLKDDVCKVVGGQLNVVLCPTHDTASAFEAVDTDAKSVFLSSGTWSLIGVRSPFPFTTPLAKEYNFANEGGPSYIRFLKNIMGMWIVNRCKKECEDISFDTIAKEIKKCDFNKTFDVNDSSLLAPESMKTAVCNLINEDPSKINTICLFKSIFDSLALSYKKAVDELELVLNTNFDNIYIVGGGANNKYLNKATEKITGKNVIALPIEATTIGNIKWQLKSGGLRK